MLTNPHPNRMPFPEILQWVMTSPKASDLSTTEIVTLFRLMRYAWLKNKSEIKDISIKQLAEELNISYPTLKKGLDSLIARGILHREATTQRNVPDLYVFLAPSVESKGFVSKRREELSERPLKEVLRAILFVSGKPLTIKRLISLLPGVSAVGIISALRELDEEMSSSSVMLLDTAEGYELVTSPAYTEVCKPLVERKKEKRLTDIEMEVLSIIMYRTRDGEQTTQEDIAKVRSASSVKTLKSLLRKGFIRVADVDDYETPFYEPTSFCLRCFNLKSIQALPPMESVSKEMLEAVRLKSKRLSNEDIAASLGIEVVEVEKLLRNAEEIVASRSKDTPSLDD